MGVVGQNGHEFSFVVPMSFLACVGNKDSDFSKEFLFFCLVDVFGSEKL